MVASASALNVGHLQLRILDNVGPEKRPLIEEAATKTAQMIPKTLNKISPTVELTVSRYLDQPGSDQFVGFATKRNSTSDDVGVAVLSQNGSIGALRNMFEDLFQQAGKIFRNY